MSTPGFEADILKSEEMMSHAADMYWIHAERRNRQEVIEFCKELVVLAEIQTHLQYGRQPVFPEHEPIWVRKVRTALTIATPDQPLAKLGLLKSVWFSGDNTAYLDVSRSSNAGVTPGDFYDPVYLLWGLDSGEITTAA